MFIERMKHNWVLAELISITIFLAHPALADNNILKDSKEYALEYSKQTIATGKENSTMKDNDIKENFTPYQDSAGLVAVLADEDTNPFLMNGEIVKNLTQLYDKYKDSIVNYHSVRDCLTKEERKKENPDLTKIDWNKISSEEDADVCLFRTASSYKNPEAMKKWFELENFTGVKIVKDEESTDVWANWPSKERGVRFSSNFLMRIWLNIIVNNTSFSTRYDQNLKLISARVSNLIL